MKKSFAFVMCVMSVCAGIVISGCESDSDSTPANVVGVWSSVATQKGTAASITFTMNLIQSGKTVSGNIDGAIPVSGTVSGNKITLTADTSILTGTVNGNAMSGTWTDTDGTSGNWSATK